MGIPDHRHDHMAQRSRVHYAMTSNTGMQGPGEGLEAPERKQAPKDPGGKGST